MQPNRIGHAFAKLPVTFSEIRSQRGKLISEVLFDPTPPEPAAYIAAAQKVFRSVFFIAVQKMIKEQGTGPGYLQQIMDIPMSDAATLHRELSH